MTIEQYITKLRHTKDNMPQIIDGIIMKNKGFIVGMLKLRLFNKGTDGEGFRLKPYSKMSITRKKKKGQRTSHVTLRDTGEFYAGMFLESRDGSYIIDSTDYKTPLLKEMYGPAIMELTLEQQTNIINNIIQPELEKIISNESVNIDIEL